MGERKAVVEPIEGQNGLVKLARGEGRLVLSKKERERLMKSTRGLEKVV